MSAMMLAGVAGPDGLKVAQVEIPKPGPGELLVKVAAAGLNRADLFAEAPAALEHMARNAHFGKIALWP